MKLGSQVLHVARKDVRFARWLLLAYAGLIGASALAWVLDAERVTALSLLWGLGTVLLALITAAMLVVEDTPARGDLLWHTLPLAPSAVLLAKLLMAALLIAVALAGQAVALAGFALPGTDLVRVLARSGLLLAAVLLFAMLLGSLARDLRVALTLLSVVPIAFLVGGNLLLYALRSDVIAAPIPAGGSIVAAAAAALLVHQYLTRRTRRTTVLSLVAVLGLFLLPGVHVAAVDAERLPQPPAVPTVRVERLEPVPELPRALGLTLAPVTPDSTTRHELHSLRATLLRADGRRDSIALNTPMLTLSRGLIGEAWHMRLLNPRPAAPAHSLLLMLTPDQRTALMDGGAEVEITGVDARLAPVATSRMPLKPGASDVRAGEKLRVRSVDAALPQPRIRLEVSYAGVAADRWQRRLLRPTFEPVTQFTVVRPDLDEALMLTQNGSTGSALIVIVPGARAMRTTVDLEPGYRFVPEPPQPLDPAWLDGAELHVVHWQETASVPFRIRVRIAPAAMQ